MKKLLISLFLMIMSITPLQAYMNQSNSDARLASLIISSVSLSPKFISSVTHYTAQTKLASIQVNALAASSKAALSGTGTYTLKEGKNTIQVIVKAANGQSQTYTIEINKIGETSSTNAPSPVNVTYHHMTYQVETDLSKIRFPDHFTLSSVHLNNQEVVALKHEKADYTIVYLLDSAKKGAFYVVKDGKITAPFKSLTVKGELYIPLPLKEEKKDGFKQTTVTINQHTIKGYNFDNKADAAYKLLYLLGPDGKAHYYTYETSEGTMQLYRATSTSLSSLNPILLMTTFVLAIAFILLFIKYRSFKAMSLKKLKRMNYIVSKRKQ